MKEVVRGVALAVYVAGASLAPIAAEQPAANGTRLSLDIAVTRQVVDAEGKRVGPEPQTIKYRLVRHKTAQGWRTTMVMGAPGVEAPGAPPNPFLGGRVEVDEQGAFAMFDKDGREIAIPQGLRPALAPQMAADWPEWAGESDTPGKRHARLAEIEAKYGQAAEKVGEWSRYVRRSGEDLEELLFDPINAVPMALNVVQGGALKAHVTFDYAQQPGRGLARRAIRSETVVGERGHRTITTTEFSNITVGQEREP